MHELHSAVPCSALRNYVRAFAQRKLDPGSVEVVQPVPACLEPIVEFEFGEPPIIELGNGTSPPTFQVALIGPSAYRPVSIRLRGGLESFAIFFRPLALWQLFGLPIGKLVNKHYDCSDVIGIEVQQLRNRMADTLSFPERVQLVERYLLNKAARAFENTPVMNTALYMFDHRGRARISDMASQVSLGLRQFERRFGNEVGISPKLFARVARFQMVLDAKVNRTTTSWLTLAHAYGFHDQMHMIRDFQALSGFSPASLLQCLGDMRPPALAACSLSPAAHA